MEEENKEEIKKEEEKTDVEKVRDNLEALKKLNDDTEKELLRQEELKAKVTLGGKTEAGEEVKKDESTPEDYAKEILEGKHDE